MTWNTAMEHRGATARPIAVSSAFDENAIRAIAAGANRHGILTARALRNQEPLLSLARLAFRCLPQATMLGQFVRKQGDRIESGKLPEDILLAPFAELARVAGGRNKSFLTHSVGNATWKVSYDKAARKVDYGNAEFLFSMPGSSLETFGRNTHRKLVLHEIDAHPRVRNEMLEHFYGVRRAHAEMYPEWFVRRIEAELSLADQILVPGSVVAEQMLRHGIDNGKLVQVPYGVNSADFRPPRLKPDTANVSHRLQVVCTAQICLRKGITFLLEAVHGLPVDLVLVGQIFDKEILTNLPDNVRLAGILSAEQLAELYTHCDVFVLPSIEDNFGLVVSEAASAGLPVITTREVGAHTSLSEQHIVLDAGDVRDLREALKSATKLSWERRLAIADEVAKSGWTDWFSYADQVLRKTGALS